LWTVLTYVFVTIIAAVPLAAVCLLTAEGFRNGDRTGDALVTARLMAGAHTAGGHTGDARPLIAGRVRNPSGTPVIAALDARPASLPPLLAGPLTVTVPRWTGRRKFRPGRYTCVGVVPAAGSAEFAVPVPLPARRYLLTVAVGQEGGRLRVYRLRLAGPGTALGRSEIRATVS
jgi:hypothetical protein